MARRCSARAAAVTAVLVILGTGRMHAQALPLDTSEQQRPNRPVSWPRLQLSDPVARRATLKALDEAWQLLAQPDCVALLAGFSDSSGRPLEQHLESLSLDPQTYLTMLVFIDGSREVVCVEGVFAFTAPGSRVVRLCVDELKRTSQQSPRHTAASFIHEMLHSLGLGENPPSPKEITRRVLAACHRDEIVPRHIIF